MTITLSTSHFTHTGGGNFCIDASDLNGRQRRLESFSMAKLEVILVNPKTGGQRKYGNCQVYRDNEDCLGWFLTSNEGGRITIFND